MGRVIFEILDKHPQPRPGVYEWFFDAGNEEKVSLYVGKAGGKVGASARLPSTLGRGLSELQRACGVTSDKGKSLDTDFIVGTCIMFLTKTKGYTVHWRHISDMHTDERRICEQNLPLLQGKNTRISSDFKGTKAGEDWRSTSIEHAESLVTQALEKKLVVRGSLRP